MKRVLAITTVLSLAYSVTQVSTSEQKRLIGLKSAVGLLPGMWGKVAALLFGLGCGERLDSCGSVWGSQNIH